MNGSIFLLSFISAVYGSQGLSEYCNLEATKALVQASASLLYEGFTMSAWLHDVKDKRPEAYEYLKRIETLRAAQGYVQTPDLLQKKKELFEAIVEAKTEDKPKTLAKVNALITQYPMLLTSLDEHSDLPKEGDSPILRACRVKRKDIVEVLLQAAKKNPAIVKDYVNFEKIDSKATPVLQAAAVGDTELVKYLLANGGNIKVVNKHNGSPIFMATQGGFTETVRYLVSIGADFHIPNIYKDSPLTTACSKKLTDIAKILVDAGANIYHVNGKGFTCLQIAQDHPDTAKILNAKDTELKAKTSGQTTPKQTPAAATSLPTTTAVASTSSMMPTPQSRPALQQLPPLSMAANAASLSSVYKTPPTTHANGTKPLPAPPMAQGKLPPSPVVTPAKAAAMNSSVYSRVPTTQNIPPMNNGTSHLPAPIAVPGRM